MKNFAKNSVVKIKNHFTKHAFGYVLTSIAVATGMVFVEISRANDLKEFLASKGIDWQEFVNPEYYEELKNA